jgi:hypothetical protein
MAGLPFPVVASASLAKCPSADDLAVIMRGLVKHPVVYFGSVVFSAYMPGYQVHPKPRDVDAFYTLPEGVRAGDTSVVHQLLGAVVESLQQVMPHVTVGVVGTVMNHGSAASGSGSGSMTSGGSSMQGGMSSSSSSSSPSVWPKCVTHRCGAVTYKISISGWQAVDLTFVEKSLTTIMHTAFPRQRVTITDHGISVTIISLAEALHRLCASIKVW